MSQNNIVGVLSKHKIVPVVTINRLDEVDGIIQRLQAAGIHCIEVTLRTAVAFEAIQTIKTKYGNVVDVGIGTVVNEDQIQKAIQIGVDFMVSPGINSNLATVFEKSGIAFIPGVATPSEILLAMQLGWNTLKFFPANLFGGIDALKTYGNVFPSIQFCPTGGINESSFNEFLALKNVISVGGSWMIK
ncbi:MAG: bifunctional 4-hydroxy-2-oxoglutarate aldolase/2-dehydro-3-deoxy-phosphogluconate aldolase [Flavobacteriales bacterium]|jgi:2-dehydro-3-deoxyphosphogluconate aldolase / (4S)-4-hydroxy-2-oxoglutarate aldolase